MKFSKVFLFFIVVFVSLNFTFVDAGTVTDSVTINVNAGIPVPDLKVTAWGYNNYDGPAETYRGADYTLSWGAVNYAASCTLDGSAASISGDSRYGTAYFTSKTFTLTCTNSTGQSASDSLTLSTPPSPTGVTYSCNSNSTVANLIWNVPAGYNTFYTRASRDSDGSTVLYNDNAMGASDSFSISPNTNYTAWVHTKNPSSGAWSDPIYVGIYCGRTNGGWSAWSPAKNPTCGYTGTQNRTCTNPSPSGGGADCSSLDGGNSSSTYTNTVCAPSTPTGLGVAPSSCGNNWLNLWWNGVSGATNYKVYRSGTLVYDGPGTSFSNGGLALAGTYSYTVTSSNAGGTSSSSSAVSGKVSNACTSNQDLKITTWGYSNSDGPAETYTGAPYTLTWAPVASAASCTLDGSAASVSGGSRDGTATLRSKTFTLTCTNSTGQSFSDSVILTTPPMPTNFVASCSPSALEAIFRWTPPSGYQTFYTRASRDSDGSNVLYHDNVVGTTDDFVVEPNTAYTIWMHTKNTATGAWSTSVGGPIKCIRTHTLLINKAGAGSGTVTGSGTYNYNAFVTATATPNAGSYLAGWSGDCNTIGQAVMYKDKVCTATFELNSYTVSTSAGAGGSISPSSRQVNHGSTTSFTINPNANYQISSVTGCGGTLSGSTYNTGVITAACNVVATFKLPTGDISATNCFIPTGSDSCPISVSWNTKDGFSGVTSKVNYESTLPDGSIKQNTLATANSSSGTPFILNFGSKVFNLNHNSLNLASTSASASCGSSDTLWTSKVCKDGSVAENVIIQAVSDSVRKGKKATLTWDSLNMTSCTGVNFSTGGRTSSGSTPFVSAALDKSTTFTIECLNSTGVKKSASVLIKVDSSKLEEI